MAIDYGNYAQLYGGQPVGFDQLNKGIATAIDANKERRALQAQQLDDRIWNDIIMKPFTNTAYGDVSTWGNNVFNMTAGQALKQYKTEALKHPKLYNILSQQGAFNPLTFKQRYDEMAAQYSPLINRKLEFFADSKGWSDRELQQYISSTGNPGLQDFLMDHSQAGTLAYEAGKPYKNIGLIPGAVDAFGRHSAAYVNPALQGAFRGGSSLVQIWDKPDRFARAGRAFVRGANPFQTGMTPAFQKMTSTQTKDLAKQLKGTGFSDSKIKAKLLKNAQHLQGDRIKIRKVMEKARAKGGHTAKGVKHTFRGKEYSWNKLRKKQKTIKRAAIAAEKATAKAPIATLKQYVRKKGTWSLVKLLSKHMGRRQAIAMAAKLAAGTMLTASGLGTGLGIAMNAWTIGALANVAYDALKETGGLQSPDKMLFGE